MVDAYKRRDVNWAVIFKDVVLLDRNVPIRIIGSCFFLAAESFQVDGKKIELILKMSLVLYLHLESSKNSSHTLDFVYRFMDPGFYEGSNTLHLMICASLLFNSWVHTVLLNFKIRSKT